MTWIVLGIELKRRKKIVHFRVKIFHRRWTAMKKWMAAVWKEIYRRFQTSNQIFYSIYGSWDTERSLDTTLAVFRQNLHFVEEYLQNGAKSWHAVFADQSDARNSRKWPKHFFLALWIIQKGISVTSEWSSMGDIKANMSRSFSIIKIWNLKSFRCA